MKDKITKRTVDGLIPSEKDQFLWDTEVKGFGVKVTPKAKRVYVLKYRMPNRSNTRRITIGTHGSPWTPDQARDEAIRLLGNVKDGNDPYLNRVQAKGERTVSQLCDQYVEEGCGTKKPSTVATDKGRIERHIKPLLGNRYVTDITSNDIRRFMDQVAKGATVVEGSDGSVIAPGGKGTATRTVGLLGGIFSFAVNEGMRGDNPVRGVKRFTDKKCERFLTPTELGRLGDALEAAKQGGESLTAINAIKLLIFTGCRKTEVLSLAWTEVDMELGCLRLKDSKTGQRVIPLGAPSLKLLNSMNGERDSPFVFPSPKTDSYFLGLAKVWLRIRKLAGLDDVRLHDLRHSFASVGAGAGLGLQVVGKILGHADPKTTARYSHIAEDPARAAADRIANTIEAQMMGEDIEDILATAQPNLGGHRNA
jgi:integrase